MLIDAIEKRPPMYIGDNKITSLNAFLAGYRTATSFHDIQDEKVFPPFRYFFDWTALKYGRTSSTMGWCNIILEENNNDENKSLKEFFKLYKEFKDIHPLSIEHTKLSEENINFHYSDKLTGEYSNRKPIYNNADEVFIIELSHNFGFSYFVRHQNKIIGYGWWNIFENMIDIKKSIESTFGENLEWTKLTGDLKNIANLIIKEMTLI